MTKPHVETKGPKISVVMPVYNGAAFLEETLESLRNQDFEDYEILCIDDCSTDHSARLLAQYAEKDGRFRYFKTPENLGIVPKVMNFAAPLVRGDYFAYTSQDDLYSKDWLNSLYQRAQVTKADAVLPDVEFFFAGRADNQRIVGLNGDRSAILSGRDAFVASLDWRIAGNALWKSAFLKEIGFQDFGMFADEYTVRSFFLACDTVAFCDGVFFYRQDNPDAITKKVSAKTLDAVHNTFMLWRLAKENSFDETICGPMAYKTLKSLIRAYALIFRTPQLQPYIYKCDAVFEALQSDGFRASLAAGLRSDKGFPLRFVYLRAQSSKKYLLAVARVKAVFGAVMHGKRRRG